MAHSDCITQPCEQSCTPACEDVDQPSSSEIGSPPISEWCICMASVSHPISSVDKQKNLGCLQSGKFNLQLSLPSLTGKRL